MQFPKFSAFLASSLLLIVAGCDSSNKAAPANTAADTPAATTQTAVSTAPVDPLQPRYIATIGEGIDFKRPGYPEFVVEVAGISDAEDWGRWSNAQMAPNPRLRFAQALPKKFTLDLKVRDFFGLNAGKNVTVSAGDKKQTFELAKDIDQQVQLQFDGVTGDVIEIAVPNSSEATDKDARKMGIGLIALSIKE